MLKKLLIILLSVILLCSSFNILCFATETTSPPSSSVTIKVKMTEKMKAYYEKIQITVGQLSNDNVISQSYDFWAYDYKDFVVSTTLPNGNYILLTACIPNDFDHTPATTQYFTVGDTAHTLIEVEVKKDMSAYPDRTTAPSIFEEASKTETQSAIPETTTLAVEEQTTATIAEEITTKNTTQPEKQTSYWLSILFSALLIVMLGIILFVIIKKIKEKQNEY